METHAPMPVREKYHALPVEKCPFLVLTRNTIDKTPYYPFSLHYLSSGRLREVKNKGRFQTLSSKSGRGRLLEVFHSTLSIAS